MHTTASSLVAIAQYFWWICTSVLYGNQQIFNIEAVNDYPPIRIRIVAADSIRDSVWMEIFDSEVSMYKIYSRLCESHFLWHTVYNMHQCFLVSDVIYQNNRVLLRPFLETAQVSQYQNSSLFWIFMWLQKVLLTLTPAASPVLNSTGWHASGQYYRNGTLKMSR